MNCGSRPSHSRGERTASPHPPHPLVRSRFSDNIVFSCVSLFVCCSPCNFPGQCCSFGMSLCFVNRTLLGIFQLFSIGSCFSARKFHQIVTIGSTQEVWSVRRFAFAERSRSHMQIHAPSFSEPAMAVVVSSKRLHLSTLN